MMKQAMTRTLAIAVACAVLSACGGGSSSESGPVAEVPPMNPSQPSVGDVVKIDEVERGSCVEPVGFEADLEFLKLVDCTMPHSFEIAGTAQRSEAPGAAFPGDRVLDFESHTACRPAFEEWVGRTYDGEDLAIETIVPSRSTWRDGDREVVCLIGGVDGALLDAPVGG